MPDTKVRNTRQKEAIRSAFSQADRPLSPEEAFEIAESTHEGISVATVYRNINALVADGWLTAVEIPGSSTHYEVAGKEHHHHFQCNDCGKVFELKGCELSMKPKVPRGFLAASHEVFVYGTCVDCR